MKRILVLGAGMTSPPLIRYFLNRREYHVVVVAQDLTRIRGFMSQERLDAVQADVSDEPFLDRMIADSDIVVSLLPVSFLSYIARIAIRHRKNVISTSYRPPDVEALDLEAKTAGITILNEVGLDPGIDHMSAIRTIRRLQTRGATVTHFSSCCGGFPAPDAHNNPWGYKFSWNPRGVILAGRNDARYLRDARVIEVSGPDLFSHWWPYEVEGQGVFEIYPNRDSLAYIEPYGLSGVEGMFRGTIRYPGWCMTMKSAADLGLFDIHARKWPKGTTYAEFLTRLLPEGSGSLIHRVAEYLDVSADSDVITRLEWAGFLSDRPVPFEETSPLEVFVDRLQKMMVYRPGERDMIAMQHYFTASFPDGRIENVSSALVEVGKPWGDSAMARTVSLPAAIAARLLLDRRRVGYTGAVLPVLPEIYEPVLDELDELGIRPKERVTTSYPNPFTHSAASVKERWRYVWRPDLEIATQATTEPTKMPPVPASEGGY